MDELPADLIDAAFNVAREREVRLMQAAQQVMSLLQAHGSGIVAHLLDTDDNAGQRLRKAIEASRMAVHLPLATPPAGPDPAMSRSTAESPTAEQVLATYEVTAYDTGQHAPETLLTILHRVLEVHRDDGNGWCVGCHGYHPDGILFRYWYRLEDCPTRQAFLSAHMAPEAPAGAPEPAPLSPELHTRLIDAVEQPLRVRAAILKLAGRACGHLAEPPGGCCAGCEAWPCETTFQTAQPALDVFADSEHAPLREIRANERRRLLQLVQAMSPGEMDGWAFRDQMLALLRSPG